jgi:plastocyanin
MCASAALTAGRADDGDHGDQDDHATAEAVYLIASGGAAGPRAVEPAQLANGARVTFVSLEATAHNVVADHRLQKADAAGIRARGYGHRNAWRSFSTRASVRA